MKASDVFRSTDFVFGKKVTFDEAFPEIADLKVVVLEHGDDWGGPTPRHYGKTVGEYIDCHNRLCFKGGFSLGSILREMVAAKETHREANKFCHGYEGSPKGNRRYRPCARLFNVTIDIVYSVPDSDVPGDS
jgi:hypothetical protein